MQKLREDTVINLMREEFENRIKHLLEDIDTTVDVDGRDVNPVQPGLRVKHESTGVLYSVVEVGVDCVVLLSPEHKQITVDRDSFEDDYTLRWDNDNK